MQWEDCSGSSLLRPASRLSSFIRSILALVVDIIEDVWVGRWGGLALGGDDGRAGPAPCCELYLFV